MQDDEPEAVGRAHADREDRAPDREAERREEPDPNPLGRTTEGPPELADVRRGDRDADERDADRDGLTAREALTKEDHDEDDGQRGVARDDRAHDRDRSERECAV